MKMVKKWIIYWFISFSVIVLLGHSIIPHHHCDQHEQGDNHQENDCSPCQTSFLHNFGNSHHSSHICHFNPQSFLKQLDNVLLEAIFTSFQVRIYFQPVQIFIFENKTEYTLQFIFKLFLRGPPVF